MVPISYPFGSKGGSDVHFFGAEYMWYLFFRLTLMHAIRIYLRAGSPLIYTGGYGMCRSGETLAQRQWRTTAYIYLTVVVVKGQGVVVRGFAYGITVSKNQGFSQCGLYSRCGATRCGLTEPQRTQAFSFHESASHRTVGFSKIKICT